MMIVIARLLMLLVMAQPYWCHGRHDCGVGIYTMMAQLVMALMVVQLATTILVAIDVEIG